MGSKLIRKQENQSASSAQRGTSGIGGPLGEQIEGSCIGIGVGVSVAGIGLGMMVGFTPQGNGCSSTDLGIGSIDIVQVGCDIIVTKTLAGVVIETEHRTAKECKPPEPPKPPDPPNNEVPPSIDVNTVRGKNLIFEASANLYYATYNPGDVQNHPAVLDPRVEEGWGGSSSYGVSCPPYKIGVTWGYKNNLVVTSGTTQNQLNLWLRDCWGWGSDRTEYYVGFSLGGCIARQQKNLFRNLSGIDLPTTLPPNLFPPKKMSDCCNATTAMLRKIMKVLAVEDIEKNGIKIPKEFLAPGGTGQLKVSNYAELQLNLFRTVNRYGIDTPIRVKIKDVNKAKKGDQSVDVQFNSPAAAIQALVELAIENKGDAATRLQIQVRLIYAVTRTLKMVAGIGETVREIIKMLGSPFKWTTTRLPLEFDLSAGIKAQQKSGQGFEKKPAAAESEDGLAPGLEVNDEDTTESLLPAILTPTDYPLPVPRFVETEDDLQDLLVKTILLLGSKK